VIRFILNQYEVNSELPAGSTVLDFVRYHRHLMGTKIGCREGDCGACTVLVGQLNDGNLQYKSMTSCLMPLANAHGKHIVTVEGINFENGELNPVQQAMADEGATQCGFCTPGFVMSLAGFCLSETAATKENAIAAVDGNICRCTGYKSIERACEKIAGLMKEKNGTAVEKFVDEKKILPKYFSEIKKRLAALKKSDGQPADSNLEHISFVQSYIGGGTDLYVQKHDEIKDAQNRFVFDHPEWNGISREGNKVFIGPSATVSDLKKSPIIREIFPGFDRYAWLVSSTQIRNMATVAGNFVNASPIGDFTIFFLALNAQLILTTIKDGKERTISLREFYLGYKQLDKGPEEYISRISFEIPKKGFKFNFEKVSKRTNLDIASVNSAICISMSGEKIISAGISAGGVAPIPKYLKAASEFLVGRNLNESLTHELIAIVQSEISPISDARGSADYKRLLLGQLIKAHFMELFPELKIEDIISHVNGAKG
jgi:xanthine dehydrogenase small subunit